MLREDPAASELCGLGHLKWHEREEATKQALRDVPRWQRRCETYSTWLTPKIHLISHQADATKREQGSFFFSFLYLCSDPICQSPGIRTTHGIMQIRDFFFDLLGFSYTAVSKEVQKAKEHPVYSSSVGLRGNNDKRGQRWSARLVWADMKA